MRKFGAVLIVLSLVLGFMSTTNAFAAKPEMVTLCHAAGQEGTLQFTTMTISWNAAFGQAGHFNEDGTPAAGHENDYLGACVEAATPTTAVTITATDEPVTATPINTATLAPTNTSEPTATTAPTNTSEPTATTAPTNTLEPTEIIPTNTVIVVPTDTLVPTNTPDPTQEPTLIVPTGTVVIRLTDTPGATATLMLTSQATVTANDPKNPGPGCEETWENYNRITAVGNDASRWATRIQNQGWQNGCPVKMPATGAGSTNFGMLTLAILTGLVGLFFVTRKPIYA